MGVFRFKQFSVNDDRCTMKVGTDGVLLGAWCDVTHARRILDIGAGSGVIALMLAQRSQEDARIDAVELEEADARQAAENAAASPWPGKVNVIQQRIQEFVPDYLYDLIVCNPPYFVNSLLPPSTRRSQARHHTELGQGDLIQSAIRMLGGEGRFSVILPSKEAWSFHQKAEEHGLFRQQWTHFHTRREKPEERSLMTYGRVRTKLNEDVLVLYERDQLLSAAYQALTREFYL